MKFTNKDIISDSNPLIRTRSVNVSFPLSKEDKDILDGLREYVVNSIDDELCEKYDLSPAVGIAAIQVGIAKRMCVVYLADEDDNAVFDLQMINPRIISHTAQKTYVEGGEACLSVKEPYEGYVNRYSQIKVQYYDVNGDKKEIELDGFESIAVQHEIDHLNGILFYDHINKTDPFKVCDNCYPL